MGQTLIEVTLPRIATELANLNNNLAALIVLLRDRLDHLAHHHLHHHLHPHRHWDHCRSLRGGVHHYRLVRSEWVRPELVRPELGLRRRRVRRDWCRRYFHRGPVGRLESNPR